MNNKMVDLIVSNRRDGKNLNRKVDVRFDYRFEGKKKYFYLRFVSDLWKVPYFLPLGSVVSNGNLSNLNFLPLIHREMGINLEELWRSHGLSLYSFIHDNSEGSDDYKKESFGMVVVKFMYVFLDIPFDKMMKILNWVHNANHQRYKGTDLLLSSFDCVEKVN